MQCCALIFAGGSGKRMHNSSIPKQFLEFREKPVIIYTLELFERHPGVDGIVIACIEGWIPHLRELLKRFCIRKVVEIVPGGLTGQDSIYNGLCAVQKHFGDGSIVMIHDGVRPLIDTRTISDNIDTVMRAGSCITCVSATESFVVVQRDGSMRIPPRKDSLIARAPQSFRLGDIMDAHMRALLDDRHDFIDSCTLMHHYGYSMSTVIGPSENIKITTPIDFYMFKAVVEARQDQQVF